MKRLLSRIRHLKLHHIVFIGIICLAIFIRVYLSWEYLPFWKEQADDMLSIRSIWLNMVSGQFDKLDLYGQTGTYRWSYLTPQEKNPVYHGVAYYYILLPAAVISRFEPYGVVVFLILLGIATIWLLYQAAFLLFTNKAIAILSAFLGAVSFWLAAYSRWIWTPAMVPFFSTLALVSFLKVISGDVRFWYSFVLSLSLGSQVHDSGYVPLLFFAIASMWYKPRLPRGFLKRGLLLVLGITPVLPTLLHESTGGFVMTRALATVAQDAVVTVSSLFSSVFAYVGSVFGFTIMTQRYREFIAGTLLSDFGLLSILCGIVLLALWIFHYYRPRHSDSKKIKDVHVQTTYMPLIYGWWMVFVPIPAFVEFLYMDQIINDYSRMNNLVFALPMGIICLAYLLVMLWHRLGAIGKVACVFLVYVYVTLNILTIHDFLFSYNESNWGYEDLKTAAMHVAHYAGYDPYDLTVYRYHEGSYESIYVYEILYLIQIFPARMPESINGVTHWGITHEPLLGRKAQQRMYVVDRLYEKTKELPKGAELVARTRGYTIYRQRYQANNKKVTL